MSEPVIVTTEDTIFCENMVGATREKYDCDVVLLDEKTAVPQPGLFDPEAIVLKDSFGLSKKVLLQKLEQASTWGKVVLITTNIQEFKKSATKHIAPPETVQQWGSLLCSRTGYKLPLRAQDIEFLLENYEEPLDIICAARSLAATEQAYVVEFPYSGNWVLHILGAIGKRQHRKAIRLIEDMPDSQTYAVAQALFTFLQKSIGAHVRVGDYSFTHKSFARTVQDFSSLYKIVRDYPERQDVTKTVLVAIVGRIIHV